MYHLMLALVLAQPTAPPSPAASPPAQFSADPANLDLHPAQTGTFVVNGALGQITVESDARLASLGVTGTTVTVAAQNRTGTDVIHVRDTAGQRVDVPLRVLFDAGTIPQTLTLNVTGQVDAGWLNDQIAAAVARNAPAAPGATRSVGAATPSSAVAAQTYRVPVSMNGHGAYFDVTGTTAVTVSPVDTAAFAPPVLYYDDDPEHVASDGVLFRAPVSAAVPARIYYYHDVAGGAPRRFVVMLTTGGAASRVELTDATAGPNIDAMTVGHAVTRSFLVMKPRNEGLVLDLADASPVTLHDLPSQPRQVVAGNIDVRVLEGAPVTVTIVAVSPGVDPAALLGNPPLPGDGHHRTGAFDVSAFGFNALTFTAGGADAPVVYGAREFSPPRAGNANPAGTDFGDYGVWHTVTFTLTNPSDQPSPAFLYFRPLGGISRSSFLIDGTLQELGCVRVASPYQLAAYTLTPRSTSRVVVETMTDGGSSYPAEIGITASPPTPSPPPVSAPDGCFPKPQPSQLPSPSPSAGATPSPTEVPS